MINPTGNKLEKLLFGIFDKSIQNADRYNHNKSLWLIFTDEMKWIVEYTDSQTLWYNYQFFKNEMELVGLDCVENKDLIQKWFETRFLKPKVEDTIQNGVKHNSNHQSHRRLRVEDTIQNGVKNTQSTSALQDYTVEDTIQNGVKNTQVVIFQRGTHVEDTIQNGVKDTLELRLINRRKVEDTIENGVKNTKWMHPLSKRCRVEDTIENGVKHTIYQRQSLMVSVEDTVQNGVKQTLTANNHIFDRVEEAIQNGVKHTELKRLDPSYRVEDTIQNGVKEIRTPGEDDDLVGTLDFMSNNNTNSIPNLIDDVIEKGVKYTSSGSGKPYWEVEDTIQNGVKETLSTAGKPLRVEDAIENGVKETKGTLRRTLLGVGDIIQKGVKEINFAHNCGDTSVEDIVQNGVIHTQKIDWNRDIGLVEDVMQSGVKEIKNNNNNPHSYHHKWTINGVIKDGVKETKPIDDWVNSENIINKTIQNGVKEIHDDCSNNIARVEGIIRIGEKLD